MNIAARFRQLCEEACRLDKEYPLDVRGFEPPLVAIIELVRQHPGDRDVFVACFSALVRGEQVSPNELVPFCMRTLRFPEIRQLVLDEADRHNGTAHWARHGNYWSDILHAFDETWTHADFWNYYAFERFEATCDEAEPIPARTQYARRSDGRESRHGLGRCDL